MVQELGPWLPYVGLNTLFVCPRLALAPYLGQFSPNESTIKFSICPIHDVPLPQHKVDLLEAQAAVLLPGRVSVGLDDDLLGGSVEPDEHGGRGKGM